MSGSVVPDESQDSLICSYLFFVILGNIGSGKCKPLVELLLFRPSFTNVARTFETFVLSSAWNA